MGLTNKEISNQKIDRLHERRLMKCGEYCEIIDYIDSKHITIKFDDGTIRENMIYLYFTKGEINKGKKYNHNKHKLLIGKKYDSLEVISFSHKKYNEKTQKYTYYYNCKCDCGNECIKDNNNLTHKTKYNKTCGKCKIIKKEDMILYKRPNIIKYFKNIEDAKNTIGSHKFVDFICPHCNSISNKQIKCVVKNGYSCPYCSDNISYPEKVIREFLNILNIEYEPEKIFDWAKNKRYDFYISSLSCIIETHGIQHYEKTTLTEKTLNQEQENDKYKKEMAINNGIKNYIELDCRKSDFDVIKKSIINSNLNKIFNLNDFDWIKLNKNSINSMVTKASDIWNSIEPDKRFVIDIANKIKMSKRATMEYLKIGAELELCDYKKGSTFGNVRFNSKSKTKIKCIELDKEFNSINDCRKYLEDINNEKYNSSAISMVCSGKRHRHKGYHFEYVEK